LAAFDQLLLSEIVDKSGGGGTSAALDFQIGFVNVPRAPGGSALEATPLPEFGCQEGSQLCHSLPNSLVAEDDLAL
jgi:hypothetical protein